MTIDIDGELAVRTAAMRAAKGQQCFVINPFGGAIGVPEEDEAIPQSAGGSGRSPERSENPAVYRKRSRVAPRTSRHPEGVSILVTNIRFWECRENRAIPRRPGLRLVAGARPMNEAILERDLMQLAKKPAKLKKSTSGQRSTDKSLQVYVTYGDFEKRAVGDLYDLDRAGDVLNAAETALPGVHASGAKAASQ